MYNRQTVAALIGALIAFFAATALGVIMVGTDPELGVQIVSFFREQLAGIFIDDAPPVLAFKIFLNNLGACLLLFLGGASFGAVTIMVLMFNGMVIGAILEVVRAQQGLLYVAAAILPHGIFEIPSFLLAGAFGLLLGQALMMEWQGYGDAADTARKLGRQFVRIVIPLLAVAAFVEAFITPAVVHLLI
jgi:stage II sporulation protein M